MGRSPLVVARVRLEENHFQCRTYRLLWISTFQSHSRFSFHRKYISPWPSSSSSEGLSTPSFFTAIFWQWLQQTLKNKKGAHTTRGVCSRGYNNRTKREKERTWCRISNRWDQLAIGKYTGYSMKTLLRPLQSNSMCSLSSNSAMWLLHTGSSSLNYLRLNTLTGGH